MKIIETSEEMQDQVLKLKRAGKTIGLVPTMGFLHEGHLSLMRLAREQCDVLVVSIFVNPTQFGPNEDLDAYPRDFDRDEAFCEKEGVDFLFYPDSLYFPDASVWVDETSLSNGLCGADRPRHFRGVCTVVAKLFNLIQPDLAVFGEKDAQQLRVIERMVRDLNFPVKILRGPIVREPDGLAMSSRNKYLSPQQRIDARCLKRALDRVQQRCEEGEQSVAVLRKAMEDLILPLENTTIDYIEFVNDETCGTVEKAKGRILIALAVKFGRTRLIDNRFLDL